MKPGFLRVIKKYRETIKAGSQEIPGITGNFGLGVKVKQGKGLVMANALFQQHEMTLQMDITK